MKVLPLQPQDHATPQALREFMAQCQLAARADGQVRLVSISITVDALDPLAVLESIYEPGHPHFYAEHPSDGTAIAGAEVAVALETSGPQRFADLQTFADDAFDRTIAVGSVDAAFGGPHVFIAAAFSDEVESGEAFPAVSAFIPRWQVARARDVTTAVANVPVAADADLDVLTERVWRAHRKFGRFSFTKTPSRESQPPTEFEVSETSNFKASVGAAIERIGRGDFEKIVLARAIDLKANAPLHPLVVLDGLRQRFPDCFSFSVANGRGESFIGASPERLVRVSRGILEADVLAGTIRRGQGAAEDAALGRELLGSAKDRHEHAVVLGSIKCQLEKLGLVVEHPATPGLRKLANLQHLHTPIKAKLESAVRLLDVLGVLHPTPAVGGYPRDKAVKEIRELEQFPRGLYAGALGWMNARGGGEFMVGIRSALIAGDRARVYAGAGIVAGSKPDQEFAETELKFRALLDALKAHG